MPALEQYKAKRDFAKTPEPSGRVSRKRANSAGGIFVIHKHAATRLHYDLRLEHDGVLWSWAVTRGPSLDPSEKRLAVHVEDHPLDYAPFEGTIPKGEYGGGSVIVWDEGTWIPEGDAGAGLKKGHLRFELKGAKLNGAWHLVRLRPRAGEKRDNWLLIKSDDAAARPGEDILKDAPQSVKSGLTIEEVAEGKAGKVWHSNRGRSGPDAKSKRAAAGARKGKSSGKMPGFLEPCLATLRTTPPSGDEWLHEVKFDGYRLQAHIENGGLTLFTRSGLDWTKKFSGPVTDAFARLDCGSAIIDGEVVVLTGSGLSSFSALQVALSEGRRDRMIFYAFDLLYLDGENLLETPLAERKERLRDLLGADTDGALRLSEHFNEPGKTMLQHACRMGLEGVVSKRADAPYRGGRGHEWIKSKCTLRQEFIIAGYVPSDVAGRGLRSLVMAYHEGDALVHAGRVGTGFSGKVASDLRQRLDRLKVAEPTLSGTAAKDKRVVWVKPELVAEVEYRSRTRDGILRHASFQGLRADKPAAEVVAETPEKPNNAAGAKRKAGSSRMTSVTLSNADKVLWPETGNTKQDLLDHYAAVWDRMQPFVVNRPLSLVRAPDGIDKQRFFQKHASKGMNKAILTLSDPEDGEELLAIRDFDGLAALVQMGVVEVHVWGSTIDDIERPDNIVFDLDPDEGLGVEDVRAATLDVRRRLQELDLPAVVKTSGGKGFHVVVPLKPKAGWEAVKTFAHDFARAMEQTDPDKYTATLSRAARKGRIFIDYLRNGRGSTTVAPWSSRAKPKATVSVPVEWEAVEAKLGPADFALGNKPLKAALKAADAWAGYDKLRKALNR